MLSFRQNCSNLHQITCACLQKTIRSRPTNYWYPLSKMGWERRYLIFVCNSALTAYEWARVQRPREGEKKRVHLCSDAEVSIHSRLQLLLWSCLHSCKKPLMLYKPNKLCNVSQVRLWWHQTLACLWVFFIKRQMGRNCCNTYFHHCLLF